VWLIVYTSSFVEDLDGSTCWRLGRGRQPQIWEKLPEQPGLFFFGLSFGLQIVGVEYPGQSLYTCIHSWHLLSLAALLFGTRTLTLGVDLSSEGAKES
jgi:hypothetical protein